MPPRPIEPPALPEALTDIALNPPTPPPAPLPPGWSGSDETCLSFFGVPVAIAEADGVAMGTTGSLCRFCVVAPKRGRLRYVLLPPPPLPLRAPRMLPPPPTPLLRAAAANVAARLLRWGEADETAAAAWAGSGRLRMRS